MPKKRIKNQDSGKHNAILKAATKLFLKNGYLTTMDEVALLAGVTKQTVYAHYHNKDTLFAHMIKALCEKHSPSELSLKDKEKKPEEILYEIGISFLNLITSKEGLDATRLVIGEVRKHPELAHLYYENSSQRMVALLVGALNTMNKLGLLHVPNTESAASYFFSMLKGRYYVRMLLAVKPLPNNKEKIAHIKETVQIFMKIYSGPNPMNTKQVL